MSQSNSNRRSHLNNNNNNNSDSSNSSSRSNSTNMFNFSSSSSSSALNSQHLTSNTNNRINNDHMDTSETIIAANEPTTSSSLNISNRPVTRSYSKLQNQTSNNNHYTTTNSNQTNNKNIYSFKLQENIQQQQQHQPQQQQQQQQQIQQQKPIVPAPPAYQKILVNEKPCNLINLIENSRLTGKMTRSITNLPDKTLLVVSDRLNTNDYPILIKRLDQSSVIINLRNDSKEANDLMRILKKLENRLVHYDQNSNGIIDMAREEFEVETIDLESAKVFRQYGGIDILKRILLMSLLVTDTSDTYKSEDSYDYDDYYAMLSSSASTSTSSSSSSNSFNSFSSNLRPSSSNSNNSYNFLSSSSSSSKHHSSNSLFNYTSGNRKTTPLMENLSVLKIKCKCIYILNRLVCLPQFGKLIVNDLLRVQPLKQNQHETTITNNNNKSQSDDTSNLSNTNYDTVLLQYLFSLLMYKDSRLLACQLIESILLHMPMLNLNKITNIRFILESIDDAGLSCVCRIFAVTLSDLDLNEKKYWANAQKKHQQQQQQQQQQQLQQQQKQQQVGTSSNATTSTNSTDNGATTTTNETEQSMDSSSSSSPSTSSKKQPQPVLSIRDQNQELLLNIPTLLYRLVNLVRRKDYAIRYSGTSTELEHWIRYIDEALSDLEDNDLDSNDSDNNSMMLDSNDNDYDFNHSSNNNSNTNNNSSSSTSANNNSTNNRNNLLTSRFNTENQLYQPALLAATKLNNFVHVLYTLSLLLIGKERKRVQKTLAKLRLASALNSLFDYLIWNCRCEYHSSSNGADNQQQQQQQQQQQIRSHICPEVAVKIQFLRLVHSFCDHSEYKRVVLSREEIEEILRYNKEAQSCLQVPDSILKVESHLRCTKEKVGLLSKIVHVIKQEPFSASFRFWLTRAIESFLRGGTSYADQLFLINRGVVEDTLQNILAINFTRPKEVLQSCFDMLGELVKFNTNGFEILNTQLADSEKFNMLLRMINQSLVDSNMFLRSIFLSIEFFENNLSQLNFKTCTNRLLSHFDSFERRISLLCRMINTINVHNLSQENVSCLNTTLVLLMLANRRGYLPKYLKAIKAKSIEMILASDIIHHPMHTTTGASSSSSGSLAASNSLPMTSILNSSNIPSTSYAASSSSSSSSSSSLSSSSTSPPIDLMTNFRDLLIFWQGHYLQKDKDCVGLEQNSRIEFSYWKHTVELLLDQNTKNECSLLFYLQNDYSFINNKKTTRIDELRCD